MAFTDIHNPMLASLQEPPVTQPGLVYEPKYDGIRAIVEIDSGNGFRESIPGVVLDRAPGPWESAGILSMVMFIACGCCCLGAHASECRAVSA